MARDDFRLTTIVAMPRGMTDEEARHYLATDQLPDDENISQPSSLDALSYDDLPSFMEIQAEQMTSSVNEDLTAAYTGSGAMIALIPMNDDAERLSVSGGEETNELHCTVKYFPDAAAITDEQRALIISAVAQCAASLDAIEAEGFALAIFNPSDGSDVESDKDPCNVLLCSGDELWEAYEYICAHVHQIPGLDFSKQHMPWIPHITLAYANDADMSEYVNLIGPVEFDKIRIAFGDDVYDIPFGGYDDDDDDEYSESESQTAAGFDPAQPRDDEGKWTDEINVHKNDIVKINVPEGIDTQIKNVQDLEAGDKIAGLGRVEAYERTLPWQDAHKTNPFFKVKVEGDNEWYHLDPNGTVHIEVKKKTNKPPQWNKDKNILTSTSVDDVFSNKSSSWDDEAKRHVNEYTDAPDVNTALRNFDDETETGEKTSDVTDAIDSVLEPLTRDITVFRRVTPSAFNIENIDELTKLKGISFIDQGYLSTSIDQNMVTHEPSTKEMFESAPISLRIKVPKGTKAQFIKDVSEYPEQNEVLLGRRLKLKIRSVDIVNDQAYVTMEVAK